MTRKKTMLPEVDIGRHYVVSAVRWPGLEHSAVCYGLKDYTGKMEIADMFGRLCFLNDEEAEEAYKMFLHREKEFSAPEIRSVILGHLLSGSEMLQFRKKTLIRRKGLTKEDLELLRQ